jgi:hypothetical protein
MRLLFCNRPHQHLLFAAHKPLLLLLALLYISVVGCRQDEEDRVYNPPPAAIYEPAPDSELETGRLAVYAFAGTKYEPERDVLVQVYVSMADVEADIPLYRQWSDRRGRADFGFLNAGNYYVRLYKEIGTEKHHRLEVAQVQARQALTRNVVLF